MPCGSYSMFHEGGIGFVPDAEIEEFRGRRAINGQWERLALPCPDEPIVNFDGLSAGREDDFMDMMLADMFPTLQFIDCFQKFPDGDEAVAVQNQAEFIRMAAEYISGEFGQFFDLVKRIHVFLFTIP